jgi:phosphonate transport system ATP-binding protein
MSGSQPVIDIQSLSKTFRKSGKALDKVNLRVETGEMVALIGPSGSGKSTLLRHLSGLVQSDATPSTITLLGQVVQRNGHIASDIRHIRAEVGFIFQQFNLVGRLPLLTNVLVGMLPRVPLWRSLIRYFTYQEKREAMQALARVDMAEFATQRASTLSGGQQQRGAIARAMVQQAEIILADEPIASLDPESSRKVMESLASSTGKTGSRYSSACIRSILPRAIACAPFNSIDDIISAGKSLSFGNGDPNSTSGYLIPTYYI